MALKLSAKGLRFTLVIGDHGAVLALTDGGKLIKRLFATSPKLADRREVTALIAKYPQAPLNVLLDSMEQSYIQQTLPAVSPLSIGKLVKKRLERDLAETDIKNAVSLGRSETGRRDWKYMFISTPMTPSLAEWFSYLMSIPNRFLGIFLLPVEMENFVAKLHKDIYKNGSPPEWQIIVTQNKTGGYRQTVLHNKRTIFTRVVSPGKDSLPDIIAGSIEQETLNTLDYLRRLSFDDDSELSITMILAPDIKNSLKSINIRNHEVTLFTPYEAAQKLRLPTAAGKEDKFADLVLIANFLHCRPILKFFNPETKKLHSLLLVYNWSFHAMATIAPIFLLIYLVLGYRIYDIHSQINEVEDRKAKIEQEWNSAQTNTGNYNIDDATKITEAVSIYKKISDKQTPPLHFVKLMASAIQDEALLQAISLRVESGKAVIIFNMDFTNTGSTIEGLFENFETFTQRVKEAFNDYEVKHSKLPDKITFGVDTYVIPVQIRVNEK